MADTYRYPLTRICLRNGSMTLPLTLLGVFPEHGDIVVYDPQKDAEFAVRVEGRSVTGLTPFFETHELDVNDELVIRPLEDGRFSFTAFSRPKRPDFTRPDVLGSLLDEIVDAGVPMSEAEIRALHPQIPSGFPLKQALEREPRLHLQGGRWQVGPAPEPASPPVPHRGPRDAAAEREPNGGDRPARPAKADADASPPTATGRPRLERSEAPTSEERGRPGERARTEENKRSAGPPTQDPSGAPSVEAAAARRQRARAAQEEAEARAEVEAALGAQAAREAEILEMVRRDELEARGGDDLDTDVGSADDAETLDQRRRTRERLAAHAEDDTLNEARREREARADERRRESGGEGDEGSNAFGWDVPLTRGLRLPWLRRQEPKPAPPKPESVNRDPFRLDRLGEARPVDRSAPTAPRVTPSPRAGLFPTDAGLNSASLPPGDPAKTKRAREAFASLGYRVEGLAHGQLMLHADLGRRQERVLVHVLPDGQRLDWAALLARRREAGAQLLAVVGDHRDLHRLVSPAELAKATLWSWAGLERVTALAADLPVGPFDLEPHFERDGLFEYGLERFERAIARRVQERGTFSTVLERLAALKAPSVFLLDDVVGDTDVPRDQALRVLERLGEAPLHLVSRSESGEFCLRYRVHDALDALAAYATSLRARLPERQRERLRAVDDGAFDPIGADELAEGLGADASVGATTPADSQKPDDVKADAVAPALTSAPAASEAQRLPFAGPGLGGDDAQEDTDDVDVALVSSKKHRKRR